VFSRRQLIERVWGFDFFGDERVVDVHIGRLRKALGDDANTPNIVATVRGIGYKLIDPRRP
jgi:DNA-binding response OmpR family regulator